MATPGPFPHQPGPQPQYFRVNRDPIAGLAIFGAVTIVVMSLLIWALTFGSWVEDGSIGVFDHSRLGYFLGYFPHGLLLPLAIASAVMSLAVFAIGNARRRRTWAVLLLVCTIVMALLVLSSMLRIGGLREFAIEDDYRAVPGLAAWLSMAASLVAVVAALLVVAKPAKLITVPVADETRSGLTGELEELADLRDRGLITAEEFELKRKQILGLD